MFRTWDKYDAIDDKKKISMSMKIADFWFKIN